MSREAEPRNLPWLVVQGLDDDTVNPIAVFDFALKTIRSDLTLVKMDEVGHFFHGKLIDLKNQIENFIMPVTNKL